MPAEMSLPASSRPVRATTRFAAALLAPVLLAALAGLGCAHMGPGTILTDRVAYGEAVSDSWKRQALLNIVKLRYSDTPMFVEVAQIVSGYTVGTQTTATATASPPFFPMAPFSDHLGGLLGLQYLFTERPTISYVPQTSAQFIRNMTLPLPPSAILYLMQSGYPIDLIFDLTLDSINGLRNRGVSGAEIRPADPGYRRLTAILRRAQLTGRVGMRIEVGKDKKESLVFFMRDSDLDADSAAELAEARRLLRIDPERRDLRVVFGASSAGPDEVAMLTRSVYRVLGNLATGVCVPEAHRAEGRAPPISAGDGAEPARFAVRSGDRKPDDSFAAVRYRDRWFWIDDGDSESKRVMTYLMILLALAEPGTTRENLPFLTIQAN